MSVMIFYSFFSKQLEKYRIDRALKSMKVLPNFGREFNKFVRNESRRQADNILHDKDPLGNFTMSSLDDFSYENEFRLLEKRVPTLIASISGTISASKADPVNLCRKGFGGSRRSDDISLVPVMVQTAACILRNRHPNSISSVACVNSINNYLCHVTKQYFYMTNLLGLSYSKQTSVEIVDRVNEDHCREILSCGER